MATISAITETTELQDKAAYYLKAILPDIQQVHEEASPTFRVLWENRLFSNYTQDSIYQLLQYNLSPGGTMSRNFVFGTDTSKDIFGVKFSAKYVEAHESITIFDKSEATSDSAMYDVVKGKIAKCFQTLSFRMSYMLFSKHNEASTTNAIQGDTLYARYMYPNFKLAKELTIDLEPLHSVDDLWDGIDLAIRGNKESHTYAGLDITAGDSDINWFWQAECDNASDATTDRGTDGTARRLTGDAVDLHFSKSRVSNTGNNFMAYPYQLGTAISSEVYAKLLHAPGTAAELDSLGIEDNIQYRGTGFYEDPWMNDVYYPSDAIGGSLLGWGPDRFVLLLHDDCANGPISPSGPDFERIPNSTIMSFALLLRGNYLALKRWKLDRMNNYKL